MLIPDRIHYFSYATGVSLELPVGFSDSEQPTGASYVRYDDDDESVLAAVLVTVVADGPPGGAALLADAMAEAAGEVLGRETRTIDDETVAVAELHYPQGLPSSATMDPESTTASLLGSDLYVQFAALDLAGRFVTLTAAAPYAELDHYRPMYREALESCRFIAMEAAS